MLNLDELNLVIEDAQEQVDLHTRKVKNYSQNTPLSIKMFLIVGLML